MAFDTGSLMLAAAALGVALGAAGFLVGRLMERMAWNRLIEAGVIPRPPRPRRWG